MHIAPSKNLRSYRSPTTSLFQSLSDPTRLAIVTLLVEHEQRVADLVTALGIPQSTVSTHLTCLRQCNLVIGRSEGRQTFYSIAHPELIDMLRSAETLLSATGGTALPCGSYSQGTSGMSSLRHNEKRS